MKVFRQTPAGEWKEIDYSELCKGDRFKHVSPHDDEQIFTVVEKNDYQFFAVSSK